MTEGQRNLRDAVDGKITFTNASTGRVYALKDKAAVLFVRPRGWHLDEAHVTVNGRVASGSLFDFGLYFFHNVHSLLLLFRVSCRAVTVFTVAKGKFVCLLFSFF